MFKAIQATIYQYLIVKLTLKLRGLYIETNNNGNEQRTIGFLGDQG